MAALLFPMPGNTEAPIRKRFTRQEFDRLMSSGVFEGQRYELIDGDLIDKMGQNPAHAFCVATLLKYLIRLFGVERVRCQSPIEVSGRDSEWSYPEPDLAVLAEPKDDYQDRHPRGDELHLVVEVADTSARSDQTVKAGLYARAGVSEYWVLDVPNRVLFLYRGAVGGRYTQVVNAREGETAAPETMPAAGIGVGELLPKARGAAPAV